MYINVLKDLFVKKRNDKKLQTLRSQKIQKMSTMLQGKTLHFAHAPYNKNKY